jgi:hypothetical protein
MKIGLFTATFLDMQLEEVFKMASGLGYGAVEVPAFANNGQLDIEEIVKGNNAAELKNMVQSYGLIISALANHPEGQIVPGPMAKTQDAIFPGTRRRRSSLGWSAWSRLPVLPTPSRFRGDRLHRLRKLRVASFPGPIPRAGPTWKRTLSSAGAKSSISSANTV